MGFSYNVNVLNQKGSPAIYTDTFANRPAFGFAGRLFISNDTAAIYEDTGTAWVLIANVSSGAGTLQQVTTNGNTSNVGISVTAGGVSTNSLTDTSLTQGSVTFAGAGGLISEDNANLFWDDTNNRLGINTNTPGNSLDVHTSGTNPTIALNNTAGNQSAISFLNTSVAKWRIGNTATNTFDFYNFALAQLALTINGSNNFVQFLKSIMIAQGAGFSPQAGYNGIGGDAGGFFFNLGTNAFSAYFNFIGLSGGRTFTFPDASGTVALTSSLSGYLPLTGGTLTGALIGTTITAAQTTSNAALNINNASLSGKNWQFTPNTNGGETDLQLNYTGTGASAKVTFSNSGNVGIGTTTPAYALTVGDGTSTKDIVVKGATSGTNGGAVVGVQLGSTTSIAIGNYSALVGGTFSNLGSIYTGGDMLFLPAGTERMRITSGGNVLINSTTDDTVNKLQVTGNVKFKNAGPSIIRNSETSAGVNSYWNASDGSLTVFGNESNHPLNFITNNVDRFIISNSGVITIANLAGTGSRAVLADATGVLSAPVSDISVKENIEPLKYGLETIMKLNAVQFEFIEGYKNYGEGLQIGAIAQEVEQIIPEAVFKTPSTGLKGIDYSQFNGIYIKAIQDQQKIIESLIQRIELLENK